MQATTAPSERSSGSNGSARERVLAILGALGGALAISGSLITWVNVQKHNRAIVFRGTTFGAGKLALAAGIVMVAAAVVWLVTAGPRVRAATALIALAASAAVTVAIGTGMASRSFFDQAAPPKVHHQKNGGGTSASPSQSATAVGAVYVVGAGGATVPFDPSVPTFHALAGGGKAGKGAKGTTSTLAPGVFVALAGGILGMVAGIWSLLGGRGVKPNPIPAPAPASVPAPEEPAHVAGPITEPFAQP